MSKKAFTLIELIMVIVILGLIALIAVPTVNSILKDSKLKSYNEQVTLIENTARTYMSNNSLRLPAQDTTKSACVSIELMKSEGLLSNEPIKNPNYKSGSTIASEKTEIFNGAVKVAWNGKKYVYTYLDSKTC